MRADDLDPIANHALLAEQQHATRLQQAVQAVQYGRVAEVYIVDQEPVAVADGINEDAVGPAEHAGDHLVGKGADLRETLEH